MNIINNFGFDDGTSIHSMDLDQGILTLEMAITQEHINVAGTLDEGLVATLADNHTSYLLMSHSLIRNPGGMPISVSLSLNVQALAPIEPNTKVHVVCRVGNANLAKLHVTVMFVDAERPSSVYAWASHTKHSNNILGFANFKAAKM
ncbi:hypothetical protein BX661DRAFT_219482 [Kickxella alabastrina]|uniref:uncharacterized protein n=1 Tax=Kickxella alabastrina TaxID=61397 RepID=UPI0022202CD5|nr:uncharacterized protein BX661DRAFT_219482 [Kickxella alabastrina]KAI7830793.1 hypothetical protein BX661DRAFT_219482 [Kickxella alabastrina]